MNVAQGNAIKKVFVCVSGSNELLLASVSVYSPWRYHYPIITFFLLFLTYPKLFSGKSAKQHLEQVNGLEDETSLGMCWEIKERQKSRPKKLKHCAVH